ncbi:MAG: hypothetical protein H7263_18935, partial [Candidatus Sericytochromatia bacterium]|nr:hypothetical protein [Candidatus Sericytochromatia bacterium]
MKKLLMLTISTMLFLTSNAYALEERGNIQKSVNFVQIDQTDNSSKDHYSVKRWKKADIGQSIFVGNTIRTGIRSMTEIKYDDGTLTRIGSRSNITVNDRKINIHKGYIWGK